MIQIVIGDSSVFEYVRGDNYVTGAGIQKDGSVVSRDASAQLQSAGPGMQGRNGLRKCRLVIFGGRRI